jgi:hypothetical protein
MLVTPARQMLRLQLLLLLLLLMLLTQKVWACRANSE